MTTTPTSEKPSVHVRLPRNLIERLQRLAEEQGVSLNALLLALIAGSVGFNLADGGDD